MNGVLWQDIEEHDAVSHPSHYSGAIECKDAMKVMLDGMNATGIEAYWIGCAFKYIWRHDRKNGREDIRKAIQCLEFYLAERYE